MSILQRNKPVFYYHWFANEQTKKVTCVKIISYMIYIVCTLFNDMMQRDSLSLYDIKTFFNGVYQEVENYWIISSHDSSEYQVN